MDILKTIKLKIDIQHDDETFPFGILNTRETY